jgi:hypothetical protein
MLFLSAAASERPAAALSTAWRPRRFDAGQNGTIVRIMMPNWRREIIAETQPYSFSACFMRDLRTHFREILTPVNSL